MLRGSERAGRALALSLGIAATALLAAPTASAHPAHLVEPVVVEDFGYAPASVTIRAGRTVQWLWDNSVAHSVTSDPGSPERFDSGLRTSGDRSFLHRFDEPGVYTYGSRSGVGDMAGRVEVLPAPGVEPRIRKLRVRGRSRPKARFRINTGADLVGRIEHRRRGKWRQRRSFSKRASKGANRVRIPRRGLSRGRYRLKLTAYDRQGRSDSARTRFRLR